ncbi:hypothetical protein [Rhizobium leguminosarum]|uniref:hypothetical protein n=1 Tax=Rhizobium leguminosarum TaxID=384 RepID=UPI001C95F608|nr:hypothetical protein [Rhizobium leguminosarum]MBY5520540.1 hypothetical protein [Rhizobium leguminosarum]
MAGPFPGVDTPEIELDEPNWPLTVNVKQWGSRRAKIASERWKTLTQSLARKGLLDERKPQRDFIMAELVTKTDLAAALDTLTLRLTSVRNRV